MQTAQPQAVYHAAAYKHVTFAETAIVQALRVNALGALEVARAASEYEARYVLISSDKAVEPRGVMGATKRFAELIVLSTATARFRPIVVRFGNILGSSGSVADPAGARRRWSSPAGHRSRCDALLHDRVRGGLAGRQDRSHRAAAGDLLARHGRSDPDRRSRQSHRRACGGHRLSSRRHRTDRAAAGREAARGADDAGARHAAHRSSEDRQRTSASGVIRRGTRRAATGSPGLCRGDAQAALETLTALVDDFTPSDMARSHAARSLASSAEITAA